MNGSEGKNAATDFAYRTCGEKDSNDDQSFNVNTCSGSVIEPSSTRVQSMESILELATLAREMQNHLLQDGLIKDRKYHLTTYKTCFLHQDGLHWLVDRMLLMEQSNMATQNSINDSFATMEKYLEELKRKAARLGNLLIKAGYVSHVCNDHEFDVNHGSRVLFFHFIPVVQQCIGNKDMDDQLTVNVESVLTPMSKNDSGSTSSATGRTGYSSSLPYDDPHRIVDVSLFSIVRDFHSDFRFLRMIKDRTFHLIRYRDCFLHADGLEWFGRQVKIHYYQAAREQKLSEVITLTQHKLLPSYITKEQTERIGSRIGNLMIEHGYIAHVRNDHVFCPKHDMQLFFKFRDKMLDADYEKSGIGQFGELEIADMQQLFFEREIKQFFQQ